jgi:hypothetical protein
MEQLPPVAKSFYTTCKKCEAERYHKVLAHTGPRTAKIQCEVCSSTKAYTIKAEKAPRSTSTGSAKSPRGAAAAKAAETRQRAEHEAAYNELSSKFSGQTPTRYTVKGQFTKDAVIEHPTFGLGFVMLATDAKIDVVFKDSVRSLIHRRP